MIKRILLALAVSLPLLGAAQTVGSWKQFPLYNGRPSAVIATPSKVYYSSQGRLYSYNASSEENIDYTEILNGKRIEHIEYNPAGKYLFISYEDGNIDLLHDNGDITNLSDIRDASLRSDKIINDVDFCGDRIYVAASFGVVVFDAAKGTVVKSGIYERDIPYIAATASHILIYYDGAVYSAPVDGQINRFENFTKVQQRPVTEMLALDAEAGRVAISNDVSTISLVDVKADGTLAEVDFKAGAAPDNCRAMMPASTGIYVLSAGRLTFIRPDGAVSYLAVMPQQITSGFVASCKGPSEVWSGSENGISLYDASGSNLVVKAADIKPTGSIGVEKVQFIIPSPDGKRIYVSNVGQSWGWVAGGTSTTQSTFVIEDDNIREVTCTDPIIKNPNILAEDPDNPDRYFMAAAGNGLYVVTDRKGRSIYNRNQIPHVNMILGLGIDPEGNLWTMALDGSRKNAINMLPASVRKGNPENIKVADWQKCNIDGFCSHFDGQFLFCRKSPVVIAAEKHSNDGILFINTAGTLGNVSDDRYVIIDNFTDQDGKTYNVKTVDAMVEDRNGTVWFATSTGLFTLDNPTKALEPSFTVNRVKVPRNDGTGFADYLLDSEKFTGISVDGNNNKWIATGTSGLYQVSPSGDEILQNFTPENSPLPSVVVSSVYADNLSNRVFAGTPNGLYCYYNTSTPARPDYDEVYAFPNPVKPGYTGWISITNLMDNSMVKIMDASGQLVAQGRSEGGMFSWDGCNSAGRKVPSGVYYVFASQSSGDTSSGAVTKILIMN